MYNREDYEIKDIIEGFQLLSPDSGGLVNPNELKEIMDIMNMSDKNPFIYNIIQNLCSDEEIQQRGGIEAKDFISLLNQELDDSSTNDGLNKIFSIFANPSTNSIPLSVFSQIIGDGENFSEEGEKLKKLIIKPEINGKELNINEFHDIVTIETPKQTPSESIVYKKKPPSKKYTYNEDNINKNPENNINKVEINFNNNIINNNSNYNSINCTDSPEISEKYNNSNKLSNNSINKENNNDDKKFRFSYKKPKLDKSFSSSNEKNKNTQYNNNTDMNNNDINKFDNIKEKDDSETPINKKKYRHMRDSQNKELKNEQYQEDKVYDEKEKEKNYYNNNNTKVMIDNKYEGNEEKNDSKVERRYHRRYRDVKSSTPDKKEDNKNLKKESNKGNNSNKNSLGYLKYRRKK